MKDLNTIKLQDRGDLVGEMAVLIVEAIKDSGVSEMPHNDQRRVLRAAMALLAFD